MAGKNSKKTLQTNLILPMQPHHDEFLETMTKIFKWSQFIGIVGRGSRIWKVWGLLLLLVLLAIEGGAIWKVIKALAGWAVDTTGQRSVTARLAGTMFYSSVVASQILCTRFAWSWGNLSSFWVSVEKTMALNIPPDPKLRKRMLTALGIMALCSIVEHTISVISLVGFDCPPELILRRYTLRSHGFLFLRTEYSVFFAIPLLLISNIATVLWNFQDALVVLICMGLTSRYCRLNQYVAKFCVEENKLAKGNNMKAEAVRLYSWRKIREAYVKQATLVRKVDESIGGIILLTSFGNFYFICLQLFMGITEGLFGTVVIKQVYYFVSLFWIVIRFTWMVLAAAEVHVQSRNALQYIHTCHSRYYNVEIERLQNQLNKDYVVLSGMGFFSIDRNILLKMATAVVTYELVLIQFDNKGGADSAPANGTGQQ
uniref:Gustatory receptor 5 n=1 Tax=Conogethes punctiferalis TaxID=1133088 RepID=A0A1Y9TJV0_CONPF|nr:gustatory receptor 5 [Conogethes punctiferalis]